MIKKFINRLLGKGAAPAALAVPLGKRVEVGVAEHGIDQSLLDDYAVRVVRTLKEAGHEAYIVGGAVRDLLVGLRPKDFDVATNATPEQVKALFRRAFIIGRRFRIRPLASTTWALPLSSCLEVFSLPLTWSAAGGTTK
jgi:poly(A) polymerase